MLMFHRPEYRPATDLEHTDPGALEGKAFAHGLGSPYCRRILCLFSFLLLGFSNTPGLAQGAKPQRAIEALESCSAEERKQGCINILTRRALGDDKYAIKAQVRGGRIIWYEFNSKTGRVQRTN